MRTGSWMGVTACLCASACADVASPERSDRYGFAIDCSIPNVCTNQAGNLQLIFRWPEYSLPVRVWVEPSDDLRQAVAGAIVLWERAALYGEFRGAFVADSTLADVIFTVGAPTQISGNGADDPLDCLGLTAINISEVDTSAVASPGVPLIPTIDLPFRVRLRPRAGQSVEEVRDCFRVVAAHELGHTLGLFLESDDPGDLMHVRPRQLLATPRDRATFAALYHTEPTVRLPLTRP